MPEPLDYLFNGISNDTMLTGAETMLDLYSADVADFTAYDAGLDAAFGTAWEADIDAARDFPTDETVQDDIEEKTAFMNTSWEKCRTHFQDSKYFIEKAFPGNAAIMKSFGFDNYKEMSRDQDKVLPFMDQFHDKAQSNNAALIAQGYTQIKIDLIETLGGEYRTKQREQENAKKDRLKQTQDRIVLMNKVWASISRVNKASKSVYRNNFAKLQQYLLPGAGTNEPAEALALRGTFRNTADSQPINGGTFNLTAHNVSDTTNLNGKFGITVGVPVGNTPYEATAPGFTPRNGNVTILANETVTQDVGLDPV